MRQANSANVWPEWKVRWLLNLYPPFLFGGIRVDAVEDGMRYCRVRIRKSLLSRNLHGTTFGGTMYAAADPFHALMYWQQFARRGTRVDVWTRSATIRFLRPATSALTLEFRLDETEVESAARDLDATGKADRVHRVEAIDRHGRVCAIIEAEAHMRLPGAATEDRR